MLDVDNKVYASYIGDAYKSAGAQQLTNKFQNYIFNFMQKGDPNSSNLEDWNQWQKDANKNILYLDATKTEATAKADKTEYDYDSILTAIENDTSISEDSKDKIIKTVLNGRWFSYRLDQKYDNLSEFDK